MGVQPEVQPFIVKSYRITNLHYNYGNATLSADYVGYLYFQNHWFTPYIRVSTLRALDLWMPHLNSAYVCRVYVQNQ